MNGESRQFQRLDQFTKGAPKPQIYLRDCPVLPLLHLGWVPFTPMFKFPVMCTLTYSSKIHKEAFSFC